MGTFDTYCAICGGHPDMWDAAAQRDKSVYGIEIWLEESDIPMKAADLIDLISDDKDRAFQQEIAVLGPARDGRPMLEQEYISRETILSVNRDDIGLIHNVILRENGVVESKEELDEGTIWICVLDNTCYLWAHETCLRLLRSFTHFTESTFWDLFRHANDRPNDPMRHTYVDLSDGNACLLQRIDYLEISDSHYQYVRPWHAIRGEKMRDAFFKLNSLPNPVASLRNLLLGDGQMWAFVAPDRFPVKEAFGRQLSAFPDRASEVNANHCISKLPADVLGSIALLVSTQDMRSLLLVSNNLRSKLLEVINWASKQLIDAEAPWMLAKSDEETSRWVKEVAEMASGSEQGFPWFVYRWSCEEGSASMRNRRRIWKILKQMETLAEELGVP